ncbi:MAG: TVP38/TMEM64 family protein [Chloroflexi bacterium]|nr:MAG: TVP38/TMEM64 family protein [Chloroflexota bacterium]
MGNKVANWLKNGGLPWLGGALVVIVLAVLWFPLSRVGASPAVVRQWLEPLGALAPIAFILLNIAQIVVAPIPGYPVQALGGALFGLAFGSLYTLTGMTIGGVMAAWLGRRLGRPWLVRRLGRETLDSWERVARMNDFWTWWLILLLPVGDFPYFLAGLSRIRLTRFALAILTSRGPFTVLIVWLGDRAVDLPLTWLALLTGGIVLLVIIGFSQAHRIEAWGRRMLRRSSLQDPESPN